MDSITQAVLGAAVGELVGGRKLGNKALLWGAIAGTIPDLDVVAGQFMDIVGEITFHRGPTHSLLFAVVMSPLLARAALLLKSSRSLSFSGWVLLFFLGLTTHALLDCFTTWGTKLFWPFSDYPVAWQTVFVIDPLYTVPFAAFLVAAMRLPKESQRRHRLALAGTIVSSAYLLWGVAAKQMANAAVERSLPLLGRSDVVRYDARPSPMNTVLWNVNIETKDSFLLGSVRFFDSSVGAERWHAVPKRHDLLGGFAADPKVRRLLRVSSGLYTVEPYTSGVVINDLRFGQAGEGWLQGKGTFVFSYSVDTTARPPSIEQVERSFSQAGAMFGDLWQAISAP